MTILNDGAADNHTQDVVLDAAKQRWGRRGMRNGTTVAVATLGTGRAQFFCAGDDVADQTGELLSAFAALISAMD